MEVSPVLILRIGLMLDRGNKLFALDRINHIAQGIYDLEVIAIIVVVQYFQGPQGLKPGAIGSWLDPGTEDITGAENTGGYKDFIS